MFKKGGLKSKEFCCIETVADSRFKPTNTADGLSNRNVVIAGDDKFVEIYDAQLQNLHMVSGSVKKAWTYLPSQRYETVKCYNGSM